MNDYGKKVYVDILLKFSNFLLKIILLDQQRKQLINLLAY